MSANSPHDFPPKGEGVYNAVVIGAGTAGLVTASRTAMLGGRVALIERGQMGGDCLNYGCVPSKALISSARLVENIRRAEAWGLEKQEPRFAFEQVFARMRERRARLAPADSQEAMEKLGVDVFRGDARFASPRAVVVNGQELRARNFVIATGSRAAVPPIPGLDAVPFFTNETVFDELTRKPESLLILGGGPIGCEFGQAMQRLGVAVTIVHAGPRLLPREDPEVGEFVEGRLRAEGVDLRLESKAQSVRWDGRRAHFELKRGEGPGGTASAEAVLVATGREPRLDGLGLDAAGVEFDEKGVKTNAYLQTRQRHIYAAGDIVGPYQFTHLAGAQAAVVIRNLLAPIQFLRKKMDYSAVPWCTFLDPEVARVGLSETEAREKGIAVEVFRAPVDAVDRAVVESEEAGFIKVLTRRGGDRILGVTLVSERAGDLIHEFIVAMKHGVGFSRLAAMTHIYPTFSEIARIAGDRFRAARLSDAAKRRYARLYARARSAGAR